MVETVTFLIFLIFMNLAANPITGSPLAYA